MEPEGPVVSGISPNEGPPGTRLIIRGENLGESKGDIIDIKIRGHSCLDSLEYVSSKKLFCLTPDIVGAAEIVVETLSGGRGTCTVSYYGRAKEAKPLLDPLQESNVWQEEDHDLLVSYAATPQSPIYQKRLGDPMGLSSSTVTGAKKKLSHEDLGEMFPHGSGDLYASNFNPAWYLLEKHRFSSFENLRHGRDRLRREVKKGEQAPLGFMKDNLDTFLLCYQTLSDVNELLIRNESETLGGSLTDRVEQLLKESTKVGEDLFRGILRCKSKADQTRSALTVLQRYRFLFNLPHTIERNITNGEYEIVANDYDKAKTLFANTQVSVFKKVLKEVEHQVGKFREDLKKKLLKLPSTLEEQKKIIKYLLELDCDGDPAWDCISNMHQWMLRLLFNSKEEFQCKMHSVDDHQAVGPGDSEGRGGRGHTRNVSEASFLSTGSSSQGIGPPGVRHYSKIGGEWHGMAGGRDAGPPARILFVEDMTGLIAESLPDFWKLGQAYISGSLFQGMQMTSEREQLQHDNCTKKQGQFESRVMEIIEVYTDMVNCSLFTEAYEQLSRSRREKLKEWIPFEDKLADSSGAWLPQIVREIRICVGFLQTLPLPDKAVDITQTLAINVRTLCVDTLFHKAAKDIEVLYEREDWRVHAEEIGAITSLPILFENLVVEVLLTLKEVVIETHVKETKESAEPLLKCSVEHLHALMEHFIGCLEYLAFQQEESTEELQEPLNRKSGSEDWLGDMPILNQDEQCLVLMSNLGFTHTQVFPRLFDCFVSHGYPACPQVSDMVSEQLLELNDRLFTKYIARKSEALLGAVEEGMRAGLFDWEHCVREPTGVRSYIQEIILSLGLVHCEVHTVSPYIVRGVLSRMMQLIAEEIWGALKEVENFSHAGSLHAHVEILTLEETFSLFMDDISCKFFQDCKEHLGELNAVNEQKVRKVVDRYQKATSLQTACFRAPLVQDIPRAQN